LHVPYRLLCVTDRPKGITCETVPLWTWPDVPTQPSAPNCYRRLKLFAPDAAKLFGPRILSIDLDCVIFNDISALITRHPFRIVKGYTAPYNGSMWLLSAGARPQVYQDFDPKRSPREARMRKDGREWLGSDQAWIAHKLPGEATWGADDGVHLFHELFLRGMQTPADPRIIFFPGLTKPWSERMKRDYPHIHKAYMEYC